MRKHRYTPAQIEFLEMNIKGRHIEDLTTLFNRRFKLSLTSCSIKNAAKNRGLKSGYKHKPVHNLLFTEKHVKFLAKIVPGRHYSEIVELFNNRFGLSCTMEQLRGLCKRRGIQTGITGHFPKGHTPFNKGRKGIWYAGCEVSWFKPGQKSFNYRPIGSERINFDGYVEVKVSNTKRPPQRRWRVKHRLIWEAANGKIPKGHVVIFADGNKLNLALDNLLLITREELAVMNHCGLISTHKNLTRTGKMVADLKMAIAARKRGAKKRRSG